MANEIVTGTDYLALPSAPHTWIVKGLIPSGGSLLLYGAPKTGKSFAALQLALAIDNGHDWLGFPTAHKGRVVYVQLDTPRSVWQERLRELNISGVETASIYQADRETLAFPFDILNKEHHDMLREALRPIKPDVVVIDTIRHTHEVDENDSTTMKRVMSMLISATMPAAMIIVAHSRKPGEHGSDVINDNRGSNYLVGAVDAIAKLSKKTLVCAGRAMEDTNLRVHMEPNFFWSLDISETDAHLRVVLNDSTLTTQAAKAKELSVMTGKTEDACEKIIHRHLKSSKSSVLDTIPSLL